jgi:hypothetical protein
MVKFPRLSCWCDMWLKKNALFLNLQRSTMESGFATAKLKSFFVMCEFKKMLPLCLTN